MVDMMISSFDCWTCSFCGIGDFVWGPPIPAARGGGLPPPFGSLREGSWHTAGVTEGFLSYHGKSPVTAPPCHPLSRKGALRRRAGPSRPTRRGIRGGEGFRRLRAAESPSPLPPRYARHLPHRGRLRRCAGSPPTSPLPNTKNRPGVGRFHTFFGNYGVFLPWTPS